MLSRSRIEKIEAALETRKAAEAVEFVAGPWKTDEDFERFLQALRTNPLPILRHVAAENRRLIQEAGDDETT